MAGAKLIVRVVDFCLHFHQPGGGIDLGVDADDLALVRKVALLQSDPHCLADGKLLQILLGYGEVDLHPLQILQGRDDRARGDVLAEIDAHDADRAGEGRIDLLLVDLRLHLFKLGARGIESRPCIVEGGGGVEAAVGKGGGACESLGVAGDVGTRGDQVRLLQFVIELNQRRGFLHLVVGLEVDRLDDTGGAHRYIDALTGENGADRLDAGLPAFRCHRRRGNGDGRVTAIGEKLADHLVPEHVEPDQTAGDHADQNQKEERKKKAFHAPATRRSRDRLEENKNTQTRRSPG